MNKINNKKKDGRSRRFAVCIKAADRKYPDNIIVRLFKIYRFCKRKPHKKTGADEERKYRIYDEAWLGAAGTNDMACKGKWPARITVKEFNEHFVEVE